MSVMNDWWVCEDGIRRCLPSHFWGVSSTCVGLSVLPRLWWLRGHPGCPLTRQASPGCCLHFRSLVTAPGSLWPAPATAGVETSAELFAAAQVLFLFCF